MTDATVAADIHRAFDVELNLAAEVTFYFVVCADYLAYACGFAVSPILYLGVDVDAGFIQNCAAALRPMPKI